MRVNGIQELRPALIAVGFLAMAGCIFNIPLSPLTLAAVFLAVFTVYLADHTLPARHPFTWPVLLLCSAGFLWTGHCSGQLNPFVILGYVLLSFFYLLPLFPRRKRLQDFPFARLVSVAAGWAAAPVILKGFPFTLSSIIYFTGMLTFMIPAVMWSDLADADSDHATGRKTLTLTLSVKQRQSCLLISLFLSVLCFSSPGLRPMLPGPLIYLAGFPFLHRHPAYGDWVLLWPLMGSAVLYF